MRLVIAGLRHPHIETIIDEARLRPDVTLVAVAEPDEAIRAQAHERLGVPLFADHRQLLAQVEADVLGIGAINADRAEIAIDALHAGLHVIADKPLCTSLEQLDRLETAYAQADSHLSVALEKRFYPVTLAAERVLADGELGEVAVVTASAPHKLTRARRPAWMFDRSRYGGILNDLAVHDLDLFLHVTGALGGQVTAFTGNKANPDRPDFDDYGLAVLRTDDGTLGSFEVTWLSPEAADYHGDYRLRLTGTEGTADLRWREGVLTVATHHRPPREVELPAGLRPAQNFFDALVGGTEPAVTAAASFAATRLALLAERSATFDAPQRWDVAATSGR
jgi:predicted dehydrogenase